MLELMVARWQEVSAKIKKLASLIEEERQQQKLRSQELADLAQRAVREVEETFALIQSQVLELEQRWLEVQQALQAAKPTGWPGEEMVGELSQVLEILPLQLF